MEEKSPFGRYNNKEMLSKLKTLAVNHGDPGVTRESIKPLWNQTSRVLELMNLTNPLIPRRKRKLQHFLKDKVKSRAGVLAYEASKKQNIKKMKGGNISSSSSSRVVNVVDSEDSLNETNAMNSYSSSFKITLEDDVKDMKPTSLNVKSGCYWKNDIDFAVNKSTISLSSSSSNNLCNLEVKYQELHHIPRRRSKRLLNFIGDLPQDSPIPVGQDFQADVPKWNSDADNNADDSRWLGTRVWPIDGQNLKKTSRDIGKGRPDSCSCVSPGSSDCTSHHIKEEKRRLQADLGSAYFTWKLDEMGEEVSNSWTNEEQECFKNVAKSNRNLLKKASKKFPSKSKQDILSYYFNVHIPRCTKDDNVSNAVRLQTSAISERTRGKSTAKSCHIKP